jgi:hypothetical protein
LTAANDYSSVQVSINLSGHQISNSSIFIVVALILGGLAMATIFIYIATRKKDRLDTKDVSDTGGSLLINP